jgi:uncharacterized RDD family membrane protein YckC
MDIKHNNKNIPVVWWPIFMALAFIDAMLGMLSRMIQAVMAYMEE